MQRCFCLLFSLGARFSTLSLQRDSGKEFPGQGAKLYRAPHPWRPRSAALGPSSFGRAGKISHGRRSTRNSSLLAQGPAGSRLKVAGRLQGSSPRGSSKKPLPRKSSKKPPSRKASLRQGVVEEAAVKEVVEEAFAKEVAEEAPHQGAPHQVLAQGLCLEARRDARSGRAQVLAQGRLAHGSWGRGRAHTRRTRTRASTRGAAPGPGSRLLARGSLRGAGAHECSHECRSPLPSPTHGAQV